MSLHSSHSCTRLQLTIQGVQRSKVKIIMNFRARHKFKECLNFQSTSLINQVSPPLPLLLPRFPPFCSVLPWSWDRPDQCFPHRNGSPHQRQSSRLAFNDEEDKKGLLASGNIRRGKRNQFTWVWRLLFWISVQEMSLKSPIELFSKLFIWTERKLLELFNIE